jgi:signal transduction histidine kinase
VLENLSENAIKYGDPLGTVTIGVREVEDRVIVEVHNVGHPIALEDQQSLFELFSRTQSAERGSKKGWGLGLTLVRGITEAHGGIVRVRSLAREGTTFTLDLPRRSRQESGEAA